MSKTEGKWHFSIDRGGTFTDVLGLDPDRQIVTAKLLSESPDYPDPAIEGIRRLLNLPQDHPLPVDRIATIRMGTTVATNALLERKGASVALFITRGFRDLLEIGHQSRPHLFKLSIQKPEQIYRCVKEVTERIDCHGKIITLLNIDRVKSDLLRIQRMGITSLAIVLMHSWKNSVHEKRVAKLARDLGYKQVSVSHEIMPVLKIVGRGQTTVVDAYLSPILKLYIESVKQYTGDIQLEFMQSSGGITEAESFSGKDAILSGPAGGVVGSAAVARINGLQESIGFDMGGTSTDVSRYDGSYEKVFEVKTAGIQFQASNLNINTVAAGGGSILWFDGQKLRVGPESAGAYPGPACYGHNGPLALTDANLLLGRIIPSHFPTSFGKTRNLSLDREVTSQKFKALTEHINHKANTNFTPIDIALGFVKIADETMAKAIKEISISRGYDIRKHGLICFGGAAPQHACSIARILGIRNIIIHPLAGLLSAYGIAQAEYLKYTIQSVVKRLDNTIIRSLKNRFKNLEHPLIDEMMDRGISRKDIEIHRYLDIRPLGTDSFLSIRYFPSLEFSSEERISTIFSKVYLFHFGFIPSGVPLELVNIRVEVISKGVMFKEEKADKKSKRSRVEPGVGIRPEKIENVYFDNHVIPTPLYKRKDIGYHQPVEGPAIIADDYSTIIVEPGFKTYMNTFDHLVLEPKWEKTETTSTKRDPIMLEVFNHLFMSVAEQMGYTLRNTAHSINIKERLDFSCAIFDWKGNLVANAPHITVHLGAMSESVKAIIQDNKGQMNRGDVYVTNNPNRGGSHLPDITVIAPVFYTKRLNSGIPEESNRKQVQPDFFTAVRGHHADIGGKSPGSMPPFASKIDEEGVVIHNFLIVKEGRLREKDLKTKLLTAPYPARNIDERISDLKAQIAAINTGIIELNRLIDKYSLSTVHAYMNHIRTNSAEAMKETLGKFLRNRDRFQSYFEDFLDDGTKIGVKLTIVQGNNPPFSHRAFVDFTRTDNQTSGNLNAPLAVTKAAVLYVFRTLIDEDIPLNSGCLLPVKIRIRKGSLLNPSETAAVVGGNVETSQRIVDVLLGALGVAAASQGTMNNFLFGRKDGKGKQYYETIAGGSGATETHPGASAVQVHMTNTRSTDPEVLEYRYPEIRLERFSIRRGSGGRGKNRGGDGTVREIRFLQPRLVSILSERRNYPPYGMAGGLPGAKGKNILLKADHTRKRLGGKAELMVRKNDTIIIKTPGGGGYGKP